MKHPATPLTKTLGTAAASAGTLFALQPSTDASIIYSGPVNYMAGPIGAGFGRSQPVFTAAGTILALSVIRSAGFAPGHVIGLADLFFSTAVAVNASGGLRKFAAGNALSGANFSGAGAPLRMYKDGVATAGTWLEGETAFAAFRNFNGNYGWIRLKWTDSADANPDPNTLIAFDYAYNDVPGGAIRAGQTTDDAPDVPETGRTALLALAGFGAVALCRRRGVAALAA